MAFNANSYRRNQYRKAAKLNLAQARDIKARSARGEVYDWEAARIPHFVRLARLDWRIYLSCRRTGNLP